jgi:hypothetical protein
MIKLIGYLVVLAAIVFAAGWALDWWTISKEGDGINVSMTEKGKETMEKAKEKVGEVGRKVGDAVSNLGDETAKGTVFAVAGGMLTVQAESGPIILKMADDAKVLLNDEEVKIGDLRSGDKVEVSYDTDESGVNIAAKVTATR